MKNEKTTCSCDTKKAADSKWTKTVLPLIAGITLAAVYFSLETAVNTILFSLLKLNPSLRMTEALRFFLYEVPKILILLTVIVFFVGIIRSFFSAEKTRKMLEGRSLFAGNIMAALLGVVTPFCSCSAVPLFLGFVEAGIPLGVTFSFLISAPMINEVALILLFGLFGWKTAALYASTGLIIAIAAGWIIGKLKLERFVEDWVFEVKMRASSGEETLSWSGRISYAANSVKEIVSKVWIYIILGIAVGAFIHGYVPQNMMASIMGKGAWWSVPAAVILGVPMYSNAAGIIPIIQALLEKGASLGTALAFMMSVIGLSLPEMIILRKVLKIQMILIFTGIVAAGIMIVGFIFNLVY